MIKSFFLNEKGRKIHLASIIVVPTPSVELTPSGPIQGAMVGSPQDIQCTVGTVDGVELSAVMISWTRPGGDTIASDSRVTISPTTSSGDDYISTLQFAYLMEGDEGMYTCNVMILDAASSGTAEVQSLTGELILIISCFNILMQTKSIFYSKLLII